MVETVQMSKTTDQWMYYLYMFSLCLCRYCNMSFLDTLIHFMTVLSVKFLYIFSLYMIQMYSGAKKYLVSHQLWKFSHLKRWERPVIFIIGIPQLWETK